MARKKYHKSVPRYTDAQRAAYWKKKYNECRRAHVAYVKRSK